MQHDHLGMHNTWQMGRNANNYRLIKQLELASEAHLCIRPGLPPGTQLLSRGSLKKVTTYVLTA